MGTRLLRDHVRQIPILLRSVEEVAARIVVEAVYKGLAVVPTHIFNWQVVAFEIGRIAAHDGAPNGLRYLIFADVVAAECDVVGRFFVIINIAALLTCAAHGESAA